MDVLEYGYYLLLMARRRRGSLWKIHLYTMIKSLPKDVSNKYYIAYVRYVVIYSLLLVTKLTEEPRALVSIYN